MTDKGFELLDHTSEVGFRATGETLEEAFENAGRALFQVMTDIDDLEVEEEIEVEVESENLEALLYDFVDELIYIAEAEGVFLRGFELSIEPSTGGYRLAGVGRGERIRGEMRRQEVKAPTYSDMKVEEAGEVWVIEMFVDV